MKGVRSGQAPRTLPSSSATAEASLALHPHPCPTHWYILWYQCGTGSRLDSGPGSLQASCFLPCDLATLSEGKCPPFLSTAAGPGPGVQGHSVRLMEWYVAYIGIKSRGLNEEMSHLASYATYSELVRSQACFYPPAGVALGTG